MNLVQWFAAVVLVLFGTTLVFGGGLQTRVKKGYGITLAILGLLIISVYSFGIFEWGEVVGMPQIPPDSGRMSLSEDEIYRVEAAAELPGGEWMVAIRSVFPEECEELMGYRLPVKPPTEFIRKVGSDGKPYYLACSLAKPAAEKPVETSSKSP